MINYPDEHDEKMNHIFLKLDKKERIKEKQISYLVPICVAIAIFLMKKMFEYINQLLTDFENHEKQVSWDNSYILKMFIFSIINSYYSLYYILFVKNYKGKCPKHENCYHELVVQLRSIIIVEFCGILIEIGIP